MKSIGLSQARVSVVLVKWLMCLSLSTGYAGEIPPLQWNVEGMGGLPVGMKTVPGLSWYHHSSDRAEAGPSPRVKYRERYHSAGTLQAELTGIQGIDILKVPPGLWVVLRSVDPLLRMGVLSSSEVQIRKGGRSFNLISGSAWLEDHRKGMRTPEVLVEAPHVRISRDAENEGPVTVIVQDDEYSEAQVWVRVLVGKVRVQPLSGGDPIGGGAEVQAGEQVQVVFPGAAQGVDNQRFFSAMEAEPEWVRAPMEEPQVQGLQRYLKAPQPAPSPSPSNEVSGG